MEHPAFVTVVMIMTFYAVLGLSISEVTEGTDDFEALYACTFAAFVFFSLELMVRTTQPLHQN